MSATTIILLVLIFALGLALGAGLILFLSRRERRVEKAGSPTKQQVAPAVLRFRFSFIALPAAIAAASVLSALVLFPSFPAQVAYRFTMAGVPASFMGRGAFFVVMALAQLASVGAAYLIANSTVKLGRRASQDQPLQIDPTRVIRLLANMVVLPQIILAYILVDAGVYAAGGRHLLTPWLFALITLGVGSVVIIALFLNSMSDYRK